jgi:hypothetical protein
MAVEHGDGGRAGAKNCMGQGGEVGLLPLIERQRPNGFD